MEFRSHGLQVCNTATDPRKADETSTTRVRGLYASNFLAEVRRGRRHKDLKVCSVTMANIDKALRPKVQIDVTKDLPPQYHARIRAFDRDLAEQLP